MNGIVYGLVDASTMELCYIGRTTQSLHKRLMFHLTQSSNPYLINWLHDADVSAIVLERNPEDLGAAEKRWIESSREQGMQLLNQQVGGRCGPVSDETRVKMSIAQRERHTLSYHRGPMSLEARARMSKAHIGQVPWNKGLTTSKETRAKISAANMGHSMSEETRAKISKAAWRKR